ncbi:CHRD domain-containing protein [Phenylobacterium sp.]|uniref:CHRD domain-containing protein n=1 Tax=Phenylobacterium sp. TaxID=1871053 RepID=UPI00398367A8
MPHLPIRLAGAACVLALFAIPASAQEGGRPLGASLTGAAEKPAAGDPDGGGDARLRVNVGQAQVCYELEVRAIAAATMAHIHKAPADAAGPVVVKLEAPAAGKSSGCATADAAVVKDILQNPGAYYVNVHNAEFPGGAVRGQLSK